MSTYEPQTLKDRKNSNKYAFKIWQNDPDAENTEITIEDFMSWMYTEYDFSEMVNKKMSEDKVIMRIQKMSKKYLESLGTGNMDKVKAGEKELLDQWIKSVKEY